MHYVRRAAVASLSIALIASHLLAGPAAAQKKYDPGASDSEIKLGQTMPYSGPASAWGLMGKVQRAFFNKLNDEGGINGRKVVLLSQDDGYTPPKTVEMTRQLVEGEGVLLMFASLGTPTNSAVHRYLNNTKVPQVFIASRTGMMVWPSRWTAPMNLSICLRCSSSFRCRRGSDKRRFWMCRYRMLSWRH